MTQTDRPDLDFRPASAAAGSPPRGFESILFAAEESEVADQPAFFPDLNLDQVVASIVAGRDEYELEPFFHTPAPDVETVAYRHEVFRDLERDDVRAAVREFAAEMRNTRRFLALARKQHYRYEQERWFLDAAVRYCTAVSALAGALAEVEPSSRGFRSLGDYAARYTRSEGFQSLASAARRVLAGLGRVRYTVRIKGARVTVSAYDGEPDYGVEIEKTFARFRLGAVGSRLVEVPDPGSMDHVEAQIVELVARLYPAELGALDDFCARHRDFLDARIARFDREAQFYLAYLEHCERLAAAGLAFCYPRVSPEAGEIAADGAFDVALAAKLTAEHKTVVRNDFSLRRPERILVVTGPNQGGKTTFARTFGQLHHLAGLGAPVPATRARLLLPDRVFTHFEREEDISTLRGKLDDELVRLRDILDHAGPRSVLVLNEMLSGTTADDAQFLGVQILSRVVELGCPAVCVTFVDELASLGEATVSMVAKVAPDDPSKRTFKIERRQADGRAYAWAIADKHGLSRERLRRRIRR